MIRLFLLVACLVLGARLAPAGALAQEGGSAPMTHGGPMMMMHGEMTHAPSAPGRPGASMPTEAGQAAFGAIQEIVAILDADPNTDWSKVDIDALRQHLVDMNAVTLEAKVASAPVEGGERFDVTGDGAVSDSIRRMLLAHAATMNGVALRLDVRGPEDRGRRVAHRPRSAERRAAKLRGLGFFGVLTLGMHHQMHHLMLARGKSPN